MPYSVLLLLQVDLTTLLGHSAARWDVEVLCVDPKEVLGLDQYQLMTTAACSGSWDCIRVSPLALP